MIEGLTRALVIVESEIARAESLMSIEEGGRPIYDRAQMDAGIAALQTVAEVIAHERTAGVTALGESREERASRYVRESGKIVHSSDCATSQAPAFEPGPCDCNALQLTTGVPASQPPSWVQRMRKAQGILANAPLPTATTQAAELELRRALDEWLTLGVPVLAEAPSGGVVWTPDDEKRLDEALAKRSAARAARSR